MQIRQETARDEKEVYDVVRLAFASAERSDGNEQDLVNALRRGDAFLPELSLVAEENGRIIGHILFTRAAVGDTAVLALAPLSVLPAFQRQGVGSALVKEGHRIGRGLGYGYSVVLGSQNYYPRFGYVPADTLGVRAPFPVPRENFMACRLTETAPGIHGMMQYAKEFGIG